MNITDEPFSYRRSVYGYGDRLFLSDLPTQFDFADPMQPNSRRISSIVPQQALFFLNNPLVIEVSRCRPASAETLDEARPEKEPNRGSTQEKTATLHNEEDPVPRTPLTPLELLVQALICSNEFVHVN